MREPAIAALCVLFVAACGNKDGGEGAAPAAKPDQATAPATPAKATTPGQGALNGRSAVPTLDEWNAVTKEVTVRGSSALNCQTKMVREWLRVSCQGKNDTGGTPTTVAVIKGGRNGEVFKFASAGVTSLVVPFVDGLDLEATFGWSDKSKKLRLSWPHGAPMPPALGAFE